MVIKPDIQSRADITLLIESFYTKVKSDDVIGKLFTEIFPLNWEIHIPLIVDFWETVLLDAAIYKENVMEKHFKLHKQHTLTPEHFERWLKIFDETLQESFSGDITELAHKRASAIAALMNFKMNTTSDKNHL